MSYSEENGEVVLRMSQEDYFNLLLALGIATGVAARDGMALKPWLELTNRINQGNPRFSAYEVKP
jgi:hypothetical protein